MHWRRTGILLISLLTLSCGSQAFDESNPSKIGGTETGNDRSVAVGFTGVDVRGVLGTETGNSKTVHGDEFQVMDMVVEAVDFRLQSGCSNQPVGGEAEYKGPSLVDLIESTIAPPLAGSDVTADNYCGADLVFAEESIRLSGTTLRRVPFHIVISDLTIVLRSSNGFSVPSGPAELSYLFVFNLGAWNFDLDSATAVNGEIEISTSQNEQLYGEIVSAIRTSTLLYVDVDGDGVLSAPEITNEGLLAVGQPSAADKINDPHQNAGPSLSDL